MLRDQLIAKTRGAVRVHEAEGTQSSALDCVLLHVEERFVAEALAR